MLKFIVIGTWYEYSAHLHVEAANEDAARAMWEDAFTTGEKSGMTLTVANLSERSDMRQFWKYNGAKSYNGEYHYEA
jgi:hypothetical protein